jgi:hypothetical protein
MCEFIITGKYNSQPELEAELSEVAVKITIITAFLSVCLSYHLPVLTFLWSDNTSFGMPNYHQ